MIEKKTVRFGPPVSALTSGILRAVLYPEEQDYVRTIERCFGNNLLEIAREMLPMRYRRDDESGVLIRDCPQHNAHPVFPPFEPGEPTEGPEEEMLDLEFRICPSDHRRHEGCHLYRCQHPNRPHEELLPAFPHGWWPPNDSTPKLWPIPDTSTPRVGFCGVAHRPRERFEAIRALLEYPQIKFDFVPRARFMGGEGELVKARREYIEHMRRNLYQLCIRGVGDYCYRFYETLSFGRIPIVVGNRSLPWASKIHWPAHVVLAETAEEIPEAVERFHREEGRNFELLCAQNRITWIAKLSPPGWWYHAAQDLDGLALA